MVRVTSVCTGSIAEAEGIVAGDILLAVNGNEIRDVLDYRFYLTDTEITLRMERNKAPYEVRFRKGEYEDVGLEFATPLMDQKHSCANKCVFCFVDQLPPGMRKTLYFKDDDDRLSFLHGNYVTLTNLKDRDVERLIKMRISPINISVHTTNPELRVKMMGNKRAGEVLAYLGRFADAGLALCTQIVLCKGLNDGAELDRSMRDLAALYPALRSCAIVPVGITRFRERLYPLEPFEKDEAAAVIRQVNAFGEECLKQYGTRLFYCADELYLKAGLPLPGEEYYEDYSQLENGVGMLTSLAAEFDFEMEDLQSLLADYQPPRTVSVATGVAAYEQIAAMAKRLSARVPGLTIHVYKIINHFFGETVTVSGLLTGTDLCEQLAGKDLGEELLYPETMLKADEDLFLDDMTPAMLSQKLHIPVRASRGEGRAFIRAVLGGSEE